MKKSVLFVCKHNSGRSQMARALLTRLSGGSVAADSAGIAPAPTVNPMVVDAMGEVGIDVSGRAPKSLTRDVVDLEDRVIAMGCSLDEARPAAGVDTEDWDLPDPAGRPIEEIRRIRDTIERRVIELLAELGRKPILER